MHPPPICSYQHLSTISCEPNIPISSFVFFLSANLITYIALTILFLVLLKIAIFFSNIMSNFHTTLLVLRLEKPEQEVRKASHCGSKQQ